MPDPVYYFLVRASCLLFGILVCTGLARADVGLVLETPTGLLGFLSNVGHVSVWISRGCLNQAGRIEFCEGSPGLVLTSTAYWPNPGAAAIPADLFFLGEQLGLQGRDPAAWTGTLAKAYPAVAPRVGAKYLGRAWLRSLRVVQFKTTPEQDRKVLAELDSELRSYSYSYSHRNCAYFAQAVLRHYLGPDFHMNRVLEFGIDTPRALERALKQSLADQETPFQTIRFRGSIWHSWREPPRNICESAVMDPKYAIPLLIYQPYIYVGFAGCYAVIRIASIAKGDPSLLLSTRKESPPKLEAEEQTLHAFERLTGASAEAFRSNLPRPLEATRPETFQAASTSASDEASGGGLTAQQ